MKPRDKDRAPLPVREIIEDVLGLEVVREGPDGRELNVLCPFCGDDKRNHLYVNATSGLWKCQKCGESGALRALPRRLAEHGVIEAAERATADARIGRARDGDRAARLREVLAGGRKRSSATVAPTEEPATDLALLAAVARVLHEALTPEHRDELRGWLSDASINRFLLGSATRDLPDRLRSAGIDLDRCAALGILRRGGGAHRVGAVTVPTFVDGGASNVEFRMPAGREPRKLSLSGRPRELFNAVALAPGERVFLTEGASDAMVLVDRGLAAVGAPSASIFKREWVDRFADCAEVVVVFDNDDAGRAGAHRVRDLLLAKGVAVRDVVLPTEHRGVRVKDVRDYLATAKAGRDDLLRLVDETSAVVPFRRESTRRVERSREHPTVRVDGQLRDLLRATREILIAAEAEERTLFRYGRGLSTLHRGALGVEIEAVSVSRLTHIAVERIDWVRGEDGGSDATPPERAMRVLAETLPDDLPELESVASGPFFDRAGEVISEPGYHAATRSYLDLPKAQPIKPMNRYRRMIVPRALDWLVSELFVDFPFQGEADRAHAIALLVLPFVRRMIDGPTPLHLIEAPGPGTGKTLLANLVSIVTTGREAQAIPLPPREDEVHKLIAAELSRGRPLILFDNLDHDPRRGHFGSAALASALTSSRPAMRRLGASEMMELPNRATWVATGNNPSLSAELARRSVRCRLDAGSDEPWRGRRFRHSNISEWARLNRDRLVLAVIRIVEAWVLEGRPNGTATLGSMESWAATLGGILDVARVPGFLGNLDDFYAEADTESADWKQLFEVWAGERAGAPLKTSELNELCVSHGLLGALRGSGSVRSQETYLANALKNQRGRVYAGWRLLAVRERGHGKTYRLDAAAGGPRADR